MEMTPNEHALWNAHMQTPVLFNHHKPLKVESPSIQHIDLNPITSSPQALIRNERVLILTPLKDAAPFLKNYFKLIAELTYPHRLIDLAFLISDSKDDTLAVLASELDHLQKRKDEVPFNSITVVEKNFHFHLSQDAEQRHGFEVQAPRRKAMAKARNYLLATALKPEHSWVYWRDVDIEQAPRRIIEDFVAHDRDILVPSKSLKDIPRQHGTDTSETFGFTGSRRVLILKVDVSPSSLAMTRDLLICNRSRLQLMDRVRQRPKAREQSAEGHSHCRRLQGIRHWARIHVQDGGLARKQRC